MKTFRNKLIPNSISDTNDMETQEDFCNNSECERDEEIDCGNCLFSEKFCKKDIFEEWKLNREDNE